MNNEGQKTAAANMEEETQSGPTPTQGQGQGQGQGWGQQLHLAGPGPPPLGGSHLWLRCLAGDPDRHRCSDPVSQRFCAPAPRGPLHRRRGPLSDRGHPGEQDR